jgi:hypothetical protein
MFEKHERFRDGTLSYVLERSIRSAQTDPPIAVIYTTKTSFTSPTRATHILFLCDSLSHITCFHMFHS